MNSGKVFVLQHEYKDENDNESTKLIGVYSTDGNARSAVEKLRKLPGFRDHPGGFSIDQYKIDEDHWTTGFSRVQE